MSARRKAGALTVHEMSGRCTRDLYRTRGYEYWTESRGGKEMIVWKRRRGGRHNPPLLYDSPRPMLSTPSTPTTAPSEPASPTQGNRPYTPTLLCHESLDESDELDYKPTPTVEEARVVEAFELVKRLGPVLMRNALTQAERNDAFNAVFQQWDTPEHRASGICRLAVALGTREGFPGEAHDTCITTGVAVQALSAVIAWQIACLLYTSPSPRDLSTSRMPSSA